MRATLQKRNASQLAISAILAVLAVWIGARELTVGADTASYARFYADKVACKCIGAKEVGFELVGLIPALVGADTQAFFTLVSIISFSLVFYIARRSASDVLRVEYLTAWRIHVACSVALIAVLLLNPLYVQSHINALRHGLASLCLIVFVIELAQRRHWRALVWAAAAISVHLSALLHIPLMLGAAITRGQRPMLVFWFITLCLGIYLLGVADDLTKWVSPRLYVFVNEYGAHALGRYHSGVRWDFALFTYFLSVGSLWYSRLPWLRPYPSARVIAEAACLSAVPFYILGWGVFSNRYLFSSWLLFSLFIGVAFGATIRSRTISPIFAWGLFAIGVSAFVYQVMVG